MNKEFDIPILFLIFNRPGTEQKVFETIKKIKPRYLYVAADGPRKDKIGEDKKCNAARKIIDEEIDWECHVKKLYQGNNLGCKKAVSSALDWFFENVEEGIILEDDCLPSQSFFRYCRELLIKYRNNRNIGIISGCKPSSLEKNTQYSYQFSRYPLIWGWAGWRRSWKYYDVNMTDWTTMRDSNWLKEILRSKISTKIWEKRFDDAYYNKIDTWDYQLVYSCWRNKLHSIHPTVNLVSNIGLNVNPTHMSGGKSVLKANEMHFPLFHPRYIEQDIKHDNYLETHEYLPRLNLLQRLYNIMRFR